ncbi:hypothetical protein B0H19DRAFT_467634 [Mycena capillaripes]|nr:hypothetical protein B0H19DRAFT_467634 [Mycena capillaripes]
MVKLHLCWTVAPILGVVVNSRGVTRYASQDGPCVKQRAVVQWQSVRRRQTFGVCAGFTQIIEGFLISQTKARWNSTSNTVASTPFLSCFL